MRNKVWSIIGISVLGGAFLSFMYVNPFGGSITLSDTILQLSGSRGEFPLGTSATELMAFVMRMFPNYIFIMIFGTHLYNHFCTASVYVFTRQANRLVWYRKEVFQLLPYTFGFQVITAVSVVLITCCRYEVIWNPAGFLLLLLHVVLHSFWVFSLTLIMNLVAMKLGSNIAFLVVAAMQMACITLIGMMHIMERSTESMHVLNAMILINPITRIIIGWHGSSNPMLSDALYSKYHVLFFSHSLVTLGIISLLAVALGGYVIKKHDLLVNDTELGVI